MSDARAQQWFIDPVTMLPSQSTIIKKPDPEGCCMGITWAAVLAAVTGKLPVYFEYTAILTKYGISKTILFDEKKIEALEKQTIRIDQMFETQNKSLGIYTFIKGVQFAIEQEDPNTLLWVESRLFNTKRVGEASVRTANQTDLKSLFALLETHMESKPFKGPVCLLLVNIDHQIAIIYDLNEKGWVFIDPNDIPLLEPEEVVTYQKSSDKIAAQCLKALSGNEYCHFFMEALVHSSLTLETKPIEQWLADTKPKLDFKMHPPIDSHGASLLHIAAREGDLTTVRLLLDHKIDPNLQTLDSKKTALHLAVQEKHPPVVTILCDHPSTALNIVDKLGISPFVYAILRGNMDVFMKLMSFKDDDRPKKHIDIHSPNDHKFTPITYAVFHRQVDMVKELLNAGVDPTQKIDSTNTLLDLAQRTKCVEIELLLKEAISKQMALSQPDSSRTGDFEEEDPFGPVMPKRTSSIPDKKEKNVLTSDPLVFEEKDENPFGEVDEDQNIASTLPRTNPPKTVADSRGQKSRQKTHFFQPESPRTGDSDEEDNPFGPVKPKPYRPKSNDNKEENNGK